MAHNSENAHVVYTVELLYYDFADDADSDVVASRQVFDTYEAAKAYGLGLTRRQCDYAALYIGEEIIGRFDYLSPEDE